ncbi:NRDE family protein [Herbidospora galbida]|uniref:NRDE family protein n=1 Tax=Herbidospora galbida TaxID=2575442 RepID=A0A4U3M4L0_9ACTN|nr:NRDE family protein [Herbidospora galbida]
MCTVIVSFDPDAESPILLAGVRDEFVNRPWMSPSAYWPDHQGVVGGRDLLAGGTWLALNPAARRVAALLNGHGLLTSSPNRASRGELPLLAASGGEMPLVELTRYDPFHLLLGGLDGVRLWTWTGDRLSEEKLRPGTYVVVNAGLPDPAENPRVARFQPAFAKAPRPGRPNGGSPERYWGEWLSLASGDGLPYEDPAALLVRHELSDGRLFTSLSVSLVALAESGVRYDFLPAPDDLLTWHPVDIPREARG